MVDLEPGKIILFRYIGYLILLCIALIFGSLVLRSLKSGSKEKSYDSGRLRYELLFD